MGPNANACALCTYFIFQFFSWWFQPMAGPWVIGLRKPSIFWNATIENSIWPRVKTKRNEDTLTSYFDVWLTHSHFLWDSFGLLTAQRIWHNQIIVIWPVGHELESPIFVLRTAGYFSHSAAFSQVKSPRDASATTSCLLMHQQT